MPGTKRSSSSSDGGGGGAKRVKPSKNAWETFMDVVQKRVAACEGYKLRYKGVLDAVDEESAPDDYDCVEEWEEPRIKEYVDALDKETVAKQEIVFVIRNGQAFCDFANAASSAIRYADPRNQPGDMFCMYTTSSSYYTQEAILKQVGKALTCIQRVPLSGPMPLISTWLPYESRTLAV